MRFLPRIGVKWWVEKLVMLSVLNLVSVEELMKAFKRLLQVLQTVYSGVCFICAILDWFSEGKESSSKSHKHALPSYWRKSKWHTICDFTYFTSAFPVGLATCILFWAIYLINPDFVMPNSLAKLIPPFYNHVTHTAPAVFLMIDTLLTCHHAPNRSNASAVVLALFFAYSTL